MKTSNKAIFSTSLLLALVAAAPSESPTYKFKISSATSVQLKNTTLTVSDETGANSSPNPLGSFSTGEPRYPYTFTLAALPEADNLYELKGTVRQTRLVVNGDPRALQLFDVPLGGEPIPIANKTETRGKFLVSEDLVVRSANDEKDGGGDFMNSGSWRACTNGTIDYQLFWYDGLSKLQDIIAGCESVTLMLEEVGSSASSTVEPSHSNTGGPFITGVPAPSTTGRPFITGIPAPSGNATTTRIIPSPSQFVGAASTLQVVGALIGLSTCVIAIFL